VNEVATAFAKPGRKTLIAYVTAGYPSIEATLEVVPVLARNGCDMIEMGIPFSDPLADGATIQNASHEALQAGVTPAKCIELAGALSGRVGVPLAFMSYYNPMLRYGLERFTADCAAAGVGGLIVPDLLPDEGAELEHAARSKGIDCIYLLAPTSTDERIRLVARRSSGFIYLVSVAGVTGARNTLPEGLEAFVDRVRSVARLPLCVGFGVSTAAQAGQVARFADGVIVGSSIVKLMESESSPAVVGRFVSGLRQALDRAAEWC